MSNAVYTFNKFLNLSMKILYLIILVGSIIYLFLVDDCNILFSICCFFISLILIGTTYYGLKNNYKDLLIITTILIIAFTIRFLWFYNMDSIPIADFNRMFLCAEEYLNGSTYMFRDYGYFSRFPHMTMTVLYFSLIIKMFSNSLIAIRFINIIYSMLNVILLFLISKEVFKDKKKSIWVLLISSIYPPMIAYNNVYCCENMAMPLLLFSVLMFFKAVKAHSKNKFLFFIISGLSLSAMQLFRPIGYIMIVAYIMYILMYFREKVKTKICVNLLLVAAFILPYIIVSYMLIALNITQNPLWHEMEPISVSVLRGTNIKYGGSWNQEDADFVSKYDEDYENLDKAAKETIKQRLTTTPAKDLFAFYVFKYTKQWCIGDFGGVYWSQLGLNDAYNKEYYLDIMGKSEGRLLVKLSDNMQIYTQIFYIVILTLSYIGLYKKKRVENYKIEFLDIMFCGLSILCLITECQVRYTYPFSWIFIILAITAFNKNNRIVNGGSK